MTIYYVGIGGSDAANGQTWANRKETLNGAEDLPVVPGDTVYVGPGTYREQLTLDVDGTSGNPIIYIADVTGINTDDVGGEVRITGSDDDIVSARDWCVYSASYGGYRIFRGFRLDLAAERLIQTHQPDGATFEYCVIGEQIATGAEGWRLFTSFGEWGDSVATIDNCIVESLIILEDATAPNTAALNVNNTFFMPTHRGDGVWYQGVPGTLTNCHFWVTGTGVDAWTTPSGSSVTIRNSTFFGTDDNFDESSGGIMVVDYCNYSNYMFTPMGSPTITNSNTWLLLPAMPLLYAGMRLPFTYGKLSEWSFMRNIAGASEASNDLWGLIRPTTSSKKSWGAVQFTDIHFEETIKQTTLASVEMRDAEREYAYIGLKAPITTIKCKVYWEANYAGTKPQVVIRVPGESTVTTTAGGDAETWYQIKTGVGPTNMSYALLELVSNNTSATGDYKVFWDDFEISP